MKRLLMVLICGFTLHCVHSQSDMQELTDSVTNRFLYQLQNFPQEKIFAHVDKNYYISGEKIWFRTHLLDASTHLANNYSRYIYVELVNPLDSLISRVKIKPDENRLFHGYVQLPEQLPEGDYTMRAYTGFMQNLDEAYFFRKKIHIGNPASSKVRSHIVYDKNNGEELVRIYFTDETHNNIKPKKVNVRYGNDRMRNLKLNEDGTGSLSSKMLNEKSGTTVYVEFEDNDIFYSEFIEVVLPEEDFDVSFFPEGGNLLAGTFSKIAFKAISSNGLSENITGEVMDEAGNVLTFIKSAHLGMGVFSMLPLAGQKYYVVCRNEKNVQKRIELPQALPDAYSLSLIYNHEKLYVSISKSANITLDEPLYVLIHSRGIVMSFLQYDKDIDILSIEKKDLPPGIVQILLLDSQLNTLSERLFFNTDNMQVNTQLITNKKEYTSRQYVSADVDIAGMENKPLPGNFSVSVTNDNDLPADTVMNILSYLTLSSEIKGYIESPEQYTGNDKRTQFKQDLLMLTQGWRRYDVPSVVKGKYSYPAHPLEIGQAISGIVKSGFFTAKGTKDNQVFILSPDRSYFDFTETDENGYFQFMNFEYPDSTRYIVQALSKRGRKTVELYLDRDTFPPVNESLHTPLQGKNMGMNWDDIFEKYTNKADQKYTMENGIRMMYLPEVKVTAQAKDQSTSIYEQIGNKIFSQETIEMASNIESLLHRIPGTQVIRNELNILSVAFRRNMRLNTGLSTARFIVDDVIMEEDFDPEIIPIQNIEDIRIINGTDVVILGSGGSGGAIVITTKNSAGLTDSVENLNIRPITPLGYQTPVEFYSPKYETREQVRNSNPDLRTTVYWKPDVVVSEDGKASFEFYTADTDRPTSYSIIIQGMTDDGQIIYKTGKIGVK